MFVSIFTALKDLPAGVLLPKQVHGEKIIEVMTGLEDLADCDALITKARGLKLGIKTADCAAVCFSDDEKIGIAHIGWRGLCLGLVEKMLREFSGEQLTVMIGSFNHSFEIKKDDCYDLICDKFGDRYFRQENGKIVFLFKEAMASLLPKNTKFDVRNTFENVSLPSWRRNMTAERLVTVVSFD